MATQPTLSELTAQCLSEQEIEDLAICPEDIPLGVYEIVVEHLKSCSDCQQRLLAQQPANVQEGQMVFS